MAPETASAVRRTDRTAALVLPEATVAGHPAKLNSETLSRGWPQRIVVPWLEVTNACLSEELALWIVLDAAH